MYKSAFYLLFILFGIIIFLLWDTKDGFSVGIPPINIRESLDWSSDNNNYPTWPTPLSCSYHR